MATLERIPFETQKKIFKRLAEVADCRCLSKEEMEKYEESQRQVANYNLGMYSAWQEENQKGKMEGRAKGELSKSLSIAHNLLLMGMSIEQVMKATGLSREQIDGMKS